MRTKTGPNGSADKHVKEIKRKTRRQFSAEEKIRIVLDGLRGESSISSFVVSLPGNRNIVSMRGAKGSPRACITIGPKTSWKLERSGWLAIQPVRRRPAKSPA